MRATTINTLSTFTRFLGSLGRPGRSGKLCSADLLAGTTAGIALIPDAMASAVIAGLNPVHGLYAVIIGTVLGSFATGSVFMSVVTTGALSVATGQALAGRSPGEVIPALATLTCLVGLFQLSAGLLRLGWILRFVSHSVMTGFLSGVGLLIILGQLDHFTGYHSPLHGALPKTLDLLRHISEIQPANLTAGALTIALILWLQRTRVESFAILLALGIVTMLAGLLHWPVPRVVDQAPILLALPAPALPDLSLLLQLIVPALGLAIIGMVQGAGVSHSYPNPDGTYPDASRDFLGQGIANLGAGLLRGMPVGGSVSGTALTVAAGATSRWANRCAGVILALVVLLAGKWVGLLPMPALAGMLILLGWQSLNFPRIGSVLKTHWPPAVAMLLTALATLYLRIELAVLVGVIASTLLHLYRSAVEFKLKQVVPDYPLPREEPAPEQLSDETVTILLPIGSLFYASAPLLEKNLPQVGNARRPVVMLLLRGRHDFGCTALAVLTRYAQALKVNGGKLMLIGVSSTIERQLQRTGALDLFGKENVFPATNRYGEAFLSAHAAAKHWLQSEPRRQLSADELAQAAETIGRLTSQSADRKPNKENK